MNFFKTFFLFTPIHVSNIVFRLTGIFNWDAGKPRARAAVFFFEKWSIVLDGPSKRLFSQHFT